MKVAYFGPEATNTHEATLKQFGNQSELLPLRTIGDVFLAVENGQVDFGVVPAENSLEGGVTFTLDMFGRPDMDDIMICAEIMLPISHHLMIAKADNTEIGDLKMIYSHPQAIGQCRQWLQVNAPKAEVQEASSTARAAQMVADNPGTAAIAPRLCAEFYGLKILNSDIQDADFNQTRFFVIYKQKPRWPMPVFNNGEEGQPVTALMISIKDRVGALYTVTSIFKRQSINLIRIESRPSKQKAWDYVFFIDIIGQPGQPHVAEALRELATETTWAKVLGWWTRSTKV